MFIIRLNYNFLSVSQLNNLRYKVEFENKIAKIYDTNGKLIGKGDQTRSNLFYLDIEDCTYVIVEFDYVWVWNKRLCKCFRESIGLQVY